MMNTQGCRTASLILAAALLDTFPGVTLLGGGTLSYGFFYDFIFPHSVHPELLSQIEEKMRQIVREKREIRSFEMMGVSAKEFLKSKKHFARASQVEGKGLFSLVEMGSFVDLCFGDVFESSAEVVDFRLLSIEHLDEKEIRIIGTFHSSKENLKKFIKSFSAYAKKKHEIIGDFKGFWKRVNGEFVWKFQGISAQNLLLAQIKKHLCSEAEEVSCPSGMSLEEGWKVCSDIDSIFEVTRVFLEPQEDVGLFVPREGTRVRMLVPLKKRISCLHSIEKTLNILGLKYRICFFRGGKDRNAEKALEEGLVESGFEFEEMADRQEASRIDFLVLDGLGREWSAISIWAKAHLDVQVLIERNLALLLEIESLKL